MRNVFVVLLVLCLLANCDNLNEKTKQTINKTGETLGKTSSTFVDGVKDGIDKTFACELLLSDQLKKAGLSLGKYSIENDGEATDNKLVMYVILNSDFDAIVQAKVLDATGAEYGRARARIKGKKDEAMFVDFIFDNRTNIEGQSRITLEKV